MAYTPILMMDLRNFDKGICVDFCVAAADIYREFPRLQSGLIVYDADKDELRGNPYVIQAITGEKAGEGRIIIRDENGDEKARVTCMEYVRMCAKSSGACVFNLDGVDFMVLSAGLNKNGWQMFKYYDALVADTFVADHETGHVVTDARQENRVIPGTEIAHPGIENRADGYAVLRSLQRFGYRGLRSLMGAGFDRAVTFVESNEPSHMSTLTIDKLQVEGVKSKNLHSLTPEAIAAIAKTHADLMTPPDEDVKAIVEAFKPLRGQMSKISPDNTKPLETLAEIITQEGANPYAVYIGARILREFLKPGGVAFDAGKFKGQVELKGEHWDGMCKEIGKALSKIPDDHRLAPIKHVVNGAVTRDTGKTFPMQKPAI